MWSGFDNAMKSVSGYVLGMVWLMNGLGNVFLWFWVAEMRSLFPLKATASVIGVRIALVAMGASFALAGYGLYKKRTYQNMLVCSVLVLQASSIIHLVSLVVEFMLAATLRWD